MSVKKARESNEKDIERAIEIHEEISHGESLTEKYPPDGIPPITPEDRSGGKGD